MNRHHIAVGIAIFCSTACLRGNETGYSALKEYKASYEFSDRTRANVAVFCDIDREHGMGLLLPRKFRLTLNGKEIGRKTIDGLLARLPGFKPETIQISRDADPRDSFVADLHPYKPRWIYTLSFDFCANAFGPAVIPPGVWEERKKATIEFDRHGIKSVTGIK